MNILEITDEERQANAVTAPVELMVDFLAMVSEEKYEEALSLAREIQETEPTNKMIKEYVKALSALLKQKDEEKMFAMLESPESSESEESSDEEESEEEKSESDDSEDDEYNESKTDILSGKANMSVSLRK